MVDHDGGYHHLFSHPVFVKELLQDFVSSPWVRDLDLDSLTRVNVKLHSDALTAAGITRREGDVLYRITTRGGGFAYLLVLVEFQSRPDPWMALRLLAYVTLIHQALIREGIIRTGEPLPPIFPVVLYNGEEPWEVRQDVGDLFSLPPESALWPYQPRMSYHVIDELRIPPATLKAMRSALSYVVRLEQCEGPKQFGEAIDGLQAFLAHPDQRELSRALGSWLNVSRPAHRFADGLDFKRVLEERPTMLAERMHKWTQQWLEEGREVGREEGREVGREEGREEGRAEGRAEGALLSSRDMLLNFAERRFGEGLRDRLRPLVEEIQDQATLTDAVEHLFSAGDADSFVDYVSGLRPPRDT